MPGYCYPSIPHGGGFADWVWGRGFFVWFCSLHKKFLLLMQDQCFQKKKDSTWKGKFFYLSDLKQNKKNSLILNLATSQTLLLKMFFSAPLFHRRDRLFINSFLCCLWKGSGPNYPILNRFSLITMKPSGEGGSAFKFHINESSTCKVAIKAAGRNFISCCLSVIFL